MISTAKELRPTHTRRQRISSHEPAIPGDGGVGNQGIANTPVELGVRVVGGNALVNAITVVGFFLLGLVSAVELSFAPRHFAAVSDRRPVTPVEAFAHSEIWVKDVIHAEL